MADIEVVYVTTSRIGEAPRRRVFVHQSGDPLPRIGESVIVDFDQGAPTRYIVQDVAHVIEDDRHGVVIRLAAPFVP